MKTLLERLKPEIKLKLESNRNEYATSIDTILIELGNNFFYDDLRIGTISSIYTFADIDLIKTSVWDLKFGENILKTRSDE